MSTYSWKTNKQKTYVGFCCICSFGTFKTLLQQANSLDKDLFNATKTI